MPSDEAVVLFGPTQASKTTTFNRLTYWSDSGVPAVTGDGSGHSVTTEPLVRQSKIGLLMDTPGINDSMRRFSNAEAGKKIALHMLRVGAKKVKVVVFEGIGNDSMQLKNTLVELVKCLGREVLKSVVVLASKADASSPAHKVKRVPAIKKEALEQGIKDVLLWQNEDLGEEDEALQLATLQAALQRVQATTTKDIEDLDTRVITRAEKLCKEASPRKVTSMTEVDEPYVETRVEQEAYTEHYQVAEIRTKAVSVATPVTKTRMVSQPYTEVVEQGGHLRQLAAAAAVATIEVPPLALAMLAVAACASESTTVTRYRDVPETYVDIEHQQRQEDYEVLVTKTRQAHRPKEVTEVKTRKKSIPVETVVPRTSQEFMAQAREEIFAEVEALFQHA